MKTLRIILVSLFAVCLLACGKDVVPTSDPASPESVEIQRKYCLAYKANDSQAMTFAVNEAKQKGAAQPVASKCQ